MPVSLDKLLLFLRLEQLFSTGRKRENNFFAGKTQQFPFKEAGFSGPSFLGVCP
jgi:hypothetical protein